MDVKSAFLNAKLAAAIYVKLPQGFEHKNCRYAKLLKSLYGLKQAARDWYQLQHKTLIQFDQRLRRSDVDPCLYFIVDLTKHLIVLISVHVDDYIIATNQQHWRESFVKFLKRNFDITDLGQLQYALGVSMKWVSATRVELSQKKNILDLLLRLGLKDSKGSRTPCELRINIQPGIMNDNLPDVPYRSVVGELFWIARNTRPDIAFAVNYFARYNNCYNTTMYKGLLRVVRYLGATIDQCLIFKSRKHVSMQFEFKLEKTNSITYSDSDWAGDHQSRRSVSGGAIYFLDNFFDGFSIIQKTVALSSSEAELMALCENVKTVLGMYHLINPIFPLKLPLKICYDNKGSAFMAANPVNNKRTRHIDTKYKFIHQYIEQGLVALEYVPTQDNIADIFTKSLPAESHYNFAGMIMNQVFDTAGATTSSTPDDATTVQQDDATGTGS